MAAVPGRAMRDWLGLSVLAIAIAAYCALALASAFDRSARAHPNLAALVPAALQAAAPAADADRFVEAGLPAPALEPARRALGADPVDPASSALVGAALLARGDRRGAERAFRVAARLGWRAPLTQLYWLETALAAEDIGAAILRFDVLARQYPQAPAMALAATRLEASEAGRAALAGRIARGANWAATYAQIDGSSGAERVLARGNVLLAAARLGAQLGCEPTARITRSLADIDPQRGAALWREHCPEAAAAGALTDAGFEAFVPSRARVPFEWRSAGDGNLAIRLVRGGTGQALELANNGVAPIPALAQLVPLAPGRYRLSWQGESGGRLRAELGCAREPRTSPVESGLGKIHTIDKACPARWLRFWLAPGGAPVLLDEVALERL